MRIIGIVGQPSSGKDTVADYVASQGFQAISTADIIREVMTEQGLPLDRPSMRVFSTKERERIGAHWPADIACERVSGDTIMSGFRNTAEVEYVKKHFNDSFVLVALVVPLEVRYERAKARNRIGDDISLAAFTEQEEAERSSNTQSHELDKVIAMADYVIENTATLETLFARVNLITGKATSIDNSEEVAHTRSAGAIITNDRAELVIVNQQAIIPWSFPKGGVHDGEDDLAAAKREILEETGISNLTYVADLGSYERPHTQGPKGIKTIHFFHFSTIDTELLPKDPMNPEARWVSFDDAHALLLQEDDRKFFEKIRHCLE